MMWQVLQNHTASSGSMDILAQTEFLWWDAVRRRVMQIRFFDEAQYADVMQSCDAH
jgi:hypothetical protein